MAYTIPTATELKAMYPAFAAVADVTVTAYITRATHTVDTTWLEADYADAIMLLACHYMVLSGLGTGAEAEINSQGMAGFNLIKSGQLTLQRSATSRADQDAPPPWNGSAYGVQFYWLMRRSKPGISVGVGPDLSETIPAAPYGWVP